MMTPEELNAVSEVIACLDKYQTRYHGVEHAQKFFDVPPDRAIHCATCEGRAIGAGKDGARIIAGRTVLFSPRQP